MSKPQWIYNVHANILWLEWRKNNNGCVSLSNGADDPVPCTCTIYLHVIFTCEWPLCNLIGTLHPPQDKHTHIHTLKQVCVIANCSRHLTCPNLTQCWPLPGSLSQQALGYESGKQTIVLCDCTRGCTFVFTWIDEDQKLFVTMEDVSVELICH